MARLITKQRTTLGGRKGGPPAVDLYLGRAVDYPDDQIEALLAAGGGTGARLVAARLLQITLGTPPAPLAPVVGPPQAPAPPPPATVDTVNLSDLGLDDARRQVTACTDTDQLFAWAMAENKGRRRKSILKLIQERTSELEGLLDPAPIVTPPAADTAPAPVDAPATTAPTTDDAPPVIPVVVDEAAPTAAPVT